MDTARDALVAPACRLMSAGKAGAVVVVDRDDALLHRLPMLFAAL